MKKERFILGAIIAFLAVCVVFLAWQHYFPAQKEIKIGAQKEAPVYTGVFAREREIALTQKFIGTVVPVHTVDVLPFISGFVDRVLVRGGQKVVAGDELFILQQKQYLAQKEAAEANVQSAESNLKNAEIYLNRIKKTKSQAVSQTELDNAINAYNSAAADLKAEKAKLLSAEVNYAYTVIKAPIDGIVGNIAITKGNYVAPAGRPLARIIQQSPVRVAFSISNKDYLKILEVGRSLFDTWTFRIKTADGKIYPLTGSFQYTDNEITKNTSGITVYVNFDNPQGVLLANAYVEVFAEKTIKGIALDKSLIHLTDKGAFVYAVRAGKIARIGVELGLNSDNLYLVSSGLKSGDYILKGTVPENMLNTPAKQPVFQKEEEG